MSFIVVFDLATGLLCRLSRPSVVPPTTGIWTASRTTCSRDTRGRILMGQSMTLRVSCTMRELDYRKSGNFHCKNIFIVDGSYDN